MADFHQEGVVTTLHSLYEAFDRETYLAELGKETELIMLRIRISPCSCHAFILN